MKHRKLLVSLLVVFVMCLTFGIATMAFAEEGELTTNIGDALSNGRITQEVTANYKTTLALTDGEHTKTRMAYKEKVDLSNFEMNFVIDQFNPDGEIRFDFLTAPTDIATRDSASNAADGFGIWVWDETAWGQPALTSLRPEPVTYSKTDGYVHLDDKACRGGANNSFVGKNILLKVWKWDENSLAYNFKIGAGATDGVDSTGGIIALTKLPQGFDYTDCYFVIAPDVDSRATSWEKDIVLSIKDVNGVTPAKGGTKTFEEVKYLNTETNEEVANGRVTIESDYGLKTTLKVTDANYSSTRAYYKKPITLDMANNKWFEMNFTIDQFNVDGGLRISFLSSSNDFPMGGYGDGFGVYFWDETAWGYAEQTALRCDFYKYGKAEGFSSGMIEGKAVRSEANKFVGQSFYLKVWEFDANTIAIQVDRNDNGTIIQQMGGFAKSNLPEGFDIKNCILMITPDLDANRAHSYEKDIVLTIKDINGEDPADVAEYVNVTATAGEHGKVVSNFKNTAVKGSNVTFTVTPDKGYEVDTATLNGEAVELTNNVYVAEATTDLAFNVTFKEVAIPEGNVTVDAISAGHGTVKVVKDGAPVAFVPENSEVTFVFDPECGYLIDQVTVNGESVTVTSETEYTMTVTENTVLNVSYKQYTFDENSNFVSGMWDAQKGRVNTIVREPGEELMFAVKDKQRTQSRAYSAPIDITKETKISFQLLDMAIGGGFSLSFMGTADDYPMCPYGDGFRVLFNDLTTALVANTTIHSRLDGSVDDYLGDGEYLMVNGTDYFTHTYTVRIADYDSSASTVKVYLDVDGTNVDYFTVNFGSLSRAFDPEACFLLLTPEINEGFETSWEKPLKVLITEYQINLTSDTPIIEPEIEEYKITYMKGDKVVKIAYAEAGHKFNKYTPDDATFVAWYTDAELTKEYDFNTIVTKDIVVYGKYETKTQSGGCFGGINTETFAVVSILAFAALFAAKKMKKCA